MFSLLEGNAFYCYSDDCLFIDTFNKCNLHFLKEAGECTNNRT